MGWAGIGQPQYNLRNRGDMKKMAFKEEHVPKNCTIPLRIFTHMNDMARTCEGDMDIFGLQGEGIKGMIEWGWGAMEK